MASFLMCISSVRRIALETSASTTAFWNDATKSALLISICFISQELM